MIRCHEADGAQLMPLSERYIVDDAFQKTIPDAEADCDPSHAHTLHVAYVSLSLHVACGLYHWSAMQCMAWHGMA